MSLFQLLTLNTPTSKQAQSKLKICSALFCLEESLFGNNIGLCTLGAAPQGQEPGVPISSGKQRLLIWTLAPGPPRGTLVYTALFGYQKMTLIGKIVYYIFFTCDQTGFFSIGLFKLQC